MVNIPENSGSEEDQDIFELVGGKETPEPQPAQPVQQTQPSNVIDLVVSFEKATGEYKVAVLPAGESTPLHAFNTKEISQIASESNSFLGNATVNLLVNTERPVIITGLPPQTNHTYYIPFDGANTENEKVFRKYVITPEKPGLAEFYLFAANANKQTDKSIGSVETSHLFNNDGALLTDKRAVGILTSIDQEFKKALKDHRKELQLNVLHLNGNYEISLNDIENNKQLFSGIADEEADFSQLVAKERGDKLLLVKVQSKDPILLTQFPNSQQEYFLLNSEEKSKEQREYGYERFVCYSRTGDGQTVNFYSSYSNAEGDIKHTTDKLYSCAITDVLDPATNTIKIPDEAILAERAAFKTYRISSNPTFTSKEVDYLFEEGVLNKDEVQFLSHKKPDDKKQAEAPKPTVAAPEEKQGFLGRFFGRKKTAAEAAVTASATTVPTTINPPVNTATGSEPEANPIAKAMNAEPSTQIQPEVITSSETEVGAGATQQPDHNSDVGIIFDNDILSAPSDQKPADQPAPGDNTVAEPAVNTTAEPEAGTTAEPAVEAATPEVPEQPAPAAAAPAKKSSAAVKYTVQAIAGISLLASGFVGGRKSAEPIPQITPTTEQGVYIQAQTGKTLIDSDNLETTNLVTEEDTKNLNAAQKVGANVILNKIKEIREKAEAALPKSYTR